MPVKDSRNQSKVNANGNQKEEDTSGGNDTIWLVDSVIDVGKLKVFGISCAR